MKEDVSAGEGDLVSQWQRQVPRKHHFLRSEINGMCIEHVTLWPQSRLHNLVNWHFPDGAQRINDSLIISAR